MKTILASLLLACALFAGACSRSDQAETTAQPTPDPKLLSQTQHLRDATAMAARKRQLAEERSKKLATPDGAQSVSPTPNAP